MKYSRFAKPVAIALVVVVVGLGSFFLGDKHGTESMSIKHVSPTQIAEAMKNDHFWRSYRENTLMVKGTVSSVSDTGSDMVVGLKTDSTYKALCDLGIPGRNLHTGDEITVLAEGGPAQRQPSAVLLKDCVLL